MKIRYIECGKVFLKSARGALEYSFLDRSDNEIAVNSINEFYLTEVANFNGKSESDSPEGKLLRPMAGTLISWNATTCVFMQIQERNENEFINKDILPETQRTFNQARLSFINKNDVKKYLKNKIGIASSLVYKNPQYHGEYKLKDYVYPDRGQIINTQIDEIIINFSLPNEWDELLKHTINKLYNNSQPEQAAEKKTPNRKTQPIVVIKPKTDLFNTLQIIDTIQYWVYPALGIITYASDYVTDRHITLSFFDKSPISNQNNILDNKIDGKEIEESRFENYFEAVSTLSSNELYHDTLFYYLRIDLSPRNAVTIFKLIENDSPFSIEEVMKIIETYLTDIKDEHLEKIIQRRFITQDQILKLRGLLSRIPVKKRLALLRQIIDKVSKDLTRYYPFHLSAMTGIDPSSQDATALREFLRDLVIHSDSEVLNLIPEGDKKSLYQELVWSDYKLSPDGKIIANNPYLQFTAKNEFNGHLTLKVLMEKKEDVFFESIHILFSTSISTQLLNRIIEGLQNGWGDGWELGTVYKFWQILPVKTADLFILLLSHLLQSHGSSSDFIENPLIFQSMLINGQDILNKWSMQDRPHNNSELKNSEQTQFPTTLFSLLNNNILLNLRKVCLTISRNLTINNVLFAYWWLSEELAYTKEDILIQDYSELIKFYKSNQIPRYTEIPKKVLFLLSGGVSDIKLSILSCVQIDNRQKTQIYPTSAFYIALVNTWLHLELKIPSADIVNLIMKLPDAVSDDVLRKIILNRNKAQSDEIKNIAPKIALRWLENTKQSRVLDSKKEDILYKIFLDLRKPTVEFVRHMLIFESSTIETITTWKGYSKKISASYNKIWKKSTPDTFTENYIHLTFFMDGLINIDKYQDLLITLAAINVQQSEKSLVETQVEAPLSTIIDFLNENKNFDSKINQMINILLSKRFSHFEFKNKISELGDNQIQVLYNYALSQTKHAEHLAQGVIEAEFERRSKNNQKNRDKKSISKETAVKNEPTTQPRKTKQQDQQSNNAAKTPPSDYSYLEIALVAILVLVIITITILIVVALSQSLFNAIWNYFNLLAGKH